MKKESINFFEYADNWEPLEWEKESPRIEKGDFYSSKIVYEDKMAGIIPGAPVPEKMELIYNDADRIISECITDMASIMDPSHMSFPANVLANCLLTGIGAVYFWNDNNESFDINTIPHAFIVPRGAEYSDEYILDSVGIGFNSAEGYELVKHINELIADAYELIATIDEEEIRAVQWRELYMAFFLYGMAYEIGRLGLKEYYSEYYIE